MKGTAAPAKEVFGHLEICAWCLGRQYASSQSEMEKVGLRVAKRLDLKLSGKCELCGNAFDRRREIEDEVIDRLNQIEFSTFQVGVALPNDSVDKEDEMRSKLKLSSGISLKKGLTTMLRRELAARLHKTTSLRNPEVTIKIDFPDEVVNIECKPVTVYVEYLKLERGVPIRATPCSACHGEGCTACEGLGIEKGDASVEAALAKAFLKAFHGDRIKISWSGIEDESSLLLGSGRPAYVEVVSPARRRTGLIQLDMMPTKGVQLTRAELAPLDRSRIEDLVKEVLVTADFESNLGTAEVRLLEQAYKERDLAVVGERRARPRRVHELVILNPGRRVKMRLLLDNGINLRQLLAIKTDSGGKQERAQPSFSDLMPTNRVLEAESEIVRFHKAGY
jgi:tRNA pseudouridine(54/55) synthase